MPATAGLQIAVSVRLIATCLSPAWPAPVQEFEFSQGGSSEAVIRRMSVTAGYGAMRCAYCAAARYSLNEKGKRRRFSAVRLIRLFGLHFQYLFSK